MGWRFRKTIIRGPIRYSITKKGIGSSIGFFGFRIGTSPSGDQYFSFGIPGSGLYYIKYFGKQKKTPPSQNSAPKQINTRQTQTNTTNNTEWWKDQKGD